MTYRAKHAKVLVGENGSLLIRSAHTYRQAPASNNTFDERQTASNKAFNTEQQRMTGKLYKPVLTTQPVCDAIRTENMGNDERSIDGQPFLTLADYRLACRAR